MIEMAGSQLRSVELDDEEIKEASDESEDSSEGAFNTYRERGRVILTMDEIDRLSRKLSNKTGKSIPQEMTPRQM